MAGMRLSAVIAITVASLLAGCNWQRVAADVAPDTVSLADRCAAIMKRAMPFAEIDIGDRTAKTTDVRVIVTEVTGTRKDMSNNAAMDRDLAVECTFTDNVLTAFRWTKGGPPPLQTEGGHPPNK
jgi:hypothetical protein